METITINKQVFSDLVNLAEEFQLKLETLELMSDPKIMESLKKSKEQIANGELTSFDEL